MFIDFLLERFEKCDTRDALIWYDQAFTYAWLAKATQGWIDRLKTGGVQPSAVVSVESDFSPDSVAVILALIEMGCCVVPLSRTLGPKAEKFKEVAQVEWAIELQAREEATVTDCLRKATHPILTSLKAKGHPGLVLFSSGSTGESKAAVHDFVPLLDKFKTTRPAIRSIAFLLFDHIGGVNTLLHIVSNGGCLVTVQDRSPDAVCATIQRHQVEVLPTSPTFINLILLSEAYRRHDLSSLQLVTYGTEVMPESTLRRFHELFPDLRLQQTYGLSEVGILRSKSKSSDSLWVKIGGEGFETRVVNGLLEIKAQSAMLGYLNAKSPFTEDGWFITGDAVLVEGEYFQILGRVSELINVGGLKVYPAQVESVLQLMPNVHDVVVTGEPNPITGHIVKAKILLETPEPLSSFRKRMREFCKGRLEPFMVPQSILFSDKEFHGNRFKKMRKD